MYIYIYDIYTQYVYIYVCMYVGMYMFICILIHIYICIYICTYVYIYMCVYIYVYIYIYIIYTQYVYIYAHVCISRIYKEREEKTSAPYSIIGDFFSPRFVAHELISNRMDSQVDVGDAWILPPHTPFGSPGQPRQLEASGKTHIGFTCQGVPFWALPRSSFGT